MTRCASRPGIGSANAPPPICWRWPARAEPSTTDLLALARKGRAFDTLGPVIARQGGYHVLFGTALACTAVLQTWSRLTGTPVVELAAEHLR